jgi:hypothetical protein
MTPRNRSTCLVVSISLLLCSNAALASEEPATDADLAQLAALKVQIEAKFEARLRARVDGVIDVAVHPEITSRTIELLARSQSRAGSPRHRGQVAPPAAPSGYGVSRETNEARSESNTACTMTGRTLQCVLRDPR